MCQQPEKSKQKGQIMEDTGSPKRLGRKKLNRSITSKEVELVI